MLRTIIMNRSSCTIKTDSYTWLSMTVHRQLVEVNRSSQDQFFGFLTKLWKLAYFHSKQTLYDRKSPLNFDFHEIHSGFQQQDSSCLLMKFYLSFKSKICFFFFSKKRDFHKPFFDREKQSKEIINLVH